MNTDRVEDALADIALNPQAHDQGTYYTESECGTTMCLAAFIAVRAGYRIMMQGNHCAVKHGQPPKSIFDAARESAGMSCNEAREMFVCSMFDSYKGLLERWEWLKEHGHGRGKVVMPADGGRSLPS